MIGAVVLCGQLLLTLPPMGQVPAHVASVAEVADPGAVPSPGTGRPDAAAPQEHAPGTTGGQSVHIRGFTDIDFSQTDNSASGDGFKLGQFVGHMSAALGGKFSFFGEVSLTPRSNEFAVEVERVILRYDYNDRLKVSAGRYHTPINYWNTAFHHGQWLQTTIDRPEMIRFGGTFMPVHFVGLLAEGTVGSPRVGLGYNFGVGNGRGAVISRSGDAGDVNRNRAWLAKVYARPAEVYGFELGAAIDHDLVSIQDTPGYPELVTSAYAALTREAPELIAEFANVRHHDPATGRDFNSQAFYIQAAWRLNPWPDFKPYARLEKMFGEPGEPVFGDVTDSTGLVGLRYEATDYIALKAEYRRLSRPETRAVNGLYLQAAFTF